jgi:iron complex transport system permease protein
MLEALPPSRRRVSIVAACSFAAVVVCALGGLAVGPLSISWTSILGNVASHVGIGHSHLTSLQVLIVWQLRAPRVVLALLAGAMLSVAGGTYQGVFRNPLADPYLLGVAAGAGLGATIAIVNLGNGFSTPTWTPALAFAGALLAVLLTWVIGGRGMRSNSSTLILAGVAVASLFTAFQTYLQQSNTSATITRVYLWLLGSLASASWHQVLVVLPSVVVCCIVCVASGRALDVLSVGDVESRSLGLPVSRVRLIVVLASSLGTAAVVSVVGLIGFVGIIIPHIVRLLVGTSYRRILPISLFFGAAFLVIADAVARTVVSPSELPIGVVTALVGAPVFVLVLNLRRSRVIWPQ